MLSGFKALYIDPILGKDFGKFRNNLKYVRNKINGWPIDIMVEPTNVCNIHCVLCPTSAEFMTRQRGFMKMDDYKKVIDNISHVTPKIALFFSGESFLHPHLIEMIMYASKEKHLRVSISTNATKMKDEQIDALLTSGLETLVVSLDGLSKETYEHYRVGANFDVVLANLKKFCSRKKELGLRYPIIQVQFICMRHNEHEVERLEEFKKEIGIDKISIKSVAIPTWYYEGKKLEEVAAEWLPTKYSRYEAVVEHVASGGRGGHTHNHGGAATKNVILGASMSGPSAFGDEQRFKIAKPEGTCGFVRKCVIGWNGDVYMCCYDFNGQYNFGNAAKEDFVNIWESERYKETRELIRNWATPLCRKCAASMEIVEEVF